mmetsp:Transcript_11216/g.30186  ORF Transcript_11216/g.30186 Transcript_11216/m.30186 type:complete len:313 (-) Transcript_11216:28-966(-)
MYAGFVGCAARVDAARRGELGASRCAARVVVAATATATAAVMSGRTVRCGEARMPAPRRERCARTMLEMVASGTGGPGGDALNGIGVVVLAGGVGKRMKADRPKQFLELRGKSIVERSLEIFLAMPEVEHIVLVVDAAFRDRFAHVEGLRFADPGKERQDSVYSGFSELRPLSCSLIAIHDAARPLVTAAEVRAVMHDAAQHGAAVLGVPSKATIKESEDGQFVLRTIPRSRLWEIHTPQVIRPDLLQQGFDKAFAERLDVTDDVSLVEFLGAPVRLTQGEYTNIKITTPEDMPIAESILMDRGDAQFTGCS